MTALKKYERLESTGVWRESKDSQRRNVYVSLGDVTLIINDSADVALAHWSLPVVRRMNPGSTPALYRPGPDAEEELEIDDTTMIDAVETVRRAVQRRDQRPWRLRRAIFLLTVAALMGLGAFWLPDAVVDYTARLLPQATREQIGQRLFTELEPVAGRVCTNRDGHLAALELTRRLFGNERWQIAVVPAGPAISAHLPGGYILIRNSVLEEGQDVTAGVLLAEVERALRDDPMHDLMRHAGLLATFRLLTQGELDDAMLASYADGFLVRAMRPVPTEPLVNRFAAANVSSSAYAYSLDASGESSLPLIEADPFPTGTPVEILPDASWLRLQNICS